MSHERDDLCQLNVNHSTIQGFFFFSANIFIIIFGVYFGIYFRPIFTIHFLDLPFFLDRTLIEMDTKALHSIKLIQTNKVLINHKIHYSNHICRNPLYQALVSCLLSCITNGAA